LAASFSTISVTPPRVGRDVRARHARADDGELELAAHGQRLELGSDALKHVEHIDGLDRHGHLARLNARQRASVIHQMQ
jgi:hypothetical protein